MSLSHSASSFVGVPELNAVQQFLKYASVNKPRLATDFCKFEVF